MPSIDMPICSLVKPRIDKRIEKLPVSASLELTCNPGIRFNRFSGSSPAGCSMIVSLSITLLARASPFPSALPVISTVVWASAPASAGASCAHAGMPHCMIMADPANITPAFLRMMLPDRLGD